MALPSGSWTLAANSRRVAARILTRVIAEKRSLTQSLDRGLVDTLGHQDRALIQALCFGTLRWYPRLDFILKKLLKRPIKANDQDIRSLALLGLFQLGFTRIKDHAAVAETVAAIGKKTWAKSLLNALLRTYQRERAKFDALIQRDPVARTAHPSWLVHQIMDDWPERFEAILFENNQHPPMAIRVNCGRIGRSKYLEALENNGVKAVNLEYCNTGLCLEAATKLDDLPGFSKGLISVQDAAAQQAAILLDVKPGQRVLDVCAAPGGKTLHILERYPEIGELLAVDIDASRLQKIRENLTRCGLDAQLVEADATRTPVWWDGTFFDRILVDAPCSATGVIRRHPDIKLLRRPEDIAAIIETQRRLLEAVWTMLKPSGILLYATCSVIKRENESQILRFLNTHPDAKEIPIKASWGIAQRCGRQTFPGDWKMDGFFYARLSKT